MTKQRKMKTTLALFVFALIFGVHLVSASDCCVADQFSAGFAGTMTRLINSQDRDKSHQDRSYPNGNLRIRFQGQVAIDHTGHRFAVNFTWFNYQDRSTGRGQILKFVNESTSYVIINSKCNKRHSTHTWEPFVCVPEEAFLDDTIFIGMNALQLNSWKMKMSTQGPIHGDLRFGTTQENCIPVFSSLIGARKMKSLGDYAHLEVDTVVYNYTMGFSPSSFTVPDICHNATSKVTDETVDLFHEWDTFQESMVFF